MGLKLPRPPHRQDGPWAWVVLMCGVLHAWLTHGFNRSFGIFLPALMDEFNETRGNVALLGSLSVGTILIMSVVTGFLCTRLDVRVVSGIGHIIRCCSLLATALLYNIIPMYFVFSLAFGVGGSFMFIPVMFSIPRYFKKKRSMAVGIVTAGAGLGVMTIPPLAQYFVDTFGWRDAMRLLACLYVGSCVCTLAYSPDVIESTVRRDQAVLPVQPMDKESKKKHLSEQFDWSLWKVPKFQIAAMSICLATFGMYNAPIHLVKFAGEIGFPATRSSFLYTYMGAATVIARLITGPLCDSPRINVSYINLSTQVLAAISVMLLTQATSYAHLIAFSVVSGLADGAFRTTITIIFVDAGGSRDKAAIAYSQAVTVTAIFQGAGPPVAGLMADQSGSYTSAFYMSGIVLLVAAAVRLVPTCISKLRHIKQGSGAEELEMSDNPALGGSGGSNRPSFVVTRL
ncbi:monocarboxylate transporter 10 isoform X1 [Nematostella vectensis]|uniref:monocarboxylate transporter 10 isoform X1 n=2 Tax=Nematostella vectensis TaxID=45351 RepID=UPI0020772222|nr:monocarboxylate transporter 10 isoform X1 [Nematostella vectensis]XP_032221639.2 monocarboxylate transporter 10 isoform X1 [Nematostella vectensis]XP_032221640.2 monocarboxylate transporter 10 isoform X1 [Nematostella vectensis]